MRTMRVVAFVVYFNSGLFSGKKKKIKIKESPEIFAGKNDLYYVMLDHFKGGSLSFPSLAGFCLGLVW